MYARIARFEGGDPGAIDEQIAEMRTQLEGASAGEPADAPEEVRTLMETVARFMQLVDRESATFVGITFCETEDDMRRADEALNRMSPGQGGGGRTAVDIFEVAIDQSFR
jgi:glutathione synthase/RimK-type ligase-like ATP-grasp enzyme